MEHKRDLSAQISRNRKMYFREDFKGNRVRWIKTLRLKEFSSWIIGWLMLRFAT
jgi:hypothetical protein